MEIKDFIRDALAQIVDGVQEANTALKEKTTLYYCPNSIWTQWMLKRTRMAFGIKDDV